MTVEKANAVYPIGSEVVVVDSLEKYSAYFGWADKFLSQDDFCRFRDTHQPDLRDNMTGRVIAVGEHLLREDTAIVAIEVADLGIYLMHTAGVIPLGHVVSSPDSRIVVRGKEVALSLKGDDLLVSVGGTTVTKDIYGVVLDAIKEIETIRIGSTVVIREGDNIYTKYQDWIVKYCTPLQAMHFDYGRSLRDGCVGKVVMMHPHLSSTANMLCLVSVIDDDEDVDFERFYLVPLHNLDLL